MRILYVEDHPAVAQMAVSLLTVQYGHDVLHVVNAADALDWAPRFQPDLILIDIGLPGMNGYELAQRLRQSPEFAQTILVALTGYAQYDDRLAALASGFDEHFAKPMDFAELESVQRRSN